MRKSVIRALRERGGYGAMKAVTKERAKGENASRKIRAGGEQSALHRRLLLTILTSVSAVVDGLKGRTESSKRCHHLEVSCMGHVSRAACSRIGKSSRQQESFLYGRSPVHHQIR